MAGVEPHSFLDQTGVTGCASFPANLIHSSTLIFEFSHLFFHFLFILGLFQMGCVYVCECVYVCLSTNVNFKDSSCENNSTGIIIYFLSELPWMVGLMSNSCHMFITPCKCGLPLLRTGATSGGHSGEADT